MVEEGEFTWEGDVLEIVEEIVEAEEVILSAPQDESTANELGAIYFHMIDPK